MIRVRPSLPSPWAIAIAVALAVAADPASAQQPPPMHQRMEAALQSDIALPDVETLRGLANAITEQTQVPVILDDAQLARAGVDGDSRVSMVGGSGPLWTRLQVALRPLALRAGPSEMGIQIRPDFAELTRRGKETDAWIGVDAEVIERFEQASQKVVSHAMLDKPLYEAIAYFGEQLGVPLVIDKRAIENLGLSPDTPVTFGSDPRRLIDVIHSTLDGLDLVLHFRHGRFQITTFANADHHPLLRIYWLDGLVDERPGYVDFSEFALLIQGFIEPTTWEVSSVPTSIQGIFPGRPGMLVTTTYTKHAQIAALLETIRQFGAGRITTYSSNGPIADAVPMRSSETGNGIPWDLPNAAGAAKAARETSEEKPAN